MTHEPRREDERELFEKWISSPPFERPIARYSEDAIKSAWPGCYTDIDVELAWESWRAASDAHQQALNGEYDKLAKRANQLEHLVGSIAELLRKDMTNE